MVICRIKCKSKKKEKAKISEEVLVQINNFENTLIYKTILKNAKKGKMLKHFDKFKIRNSQRSNFTNLMRELANIDTN